MWEDCGIWGRINIVRAAVGPQSRACEKKPMSRGHQGSDGDGPDRDRPSVQNKANSHRAPLRAFGKPTLNDQFEALAHQAIIAMK
jgi:hypothetical protein